jgi:hypothetical protein
VGVVQREFGLKPYGRIRLLTGGDLMRQSALHLGACDRELRILGECHRQELGPVPLRWRPLRRGRRHKAGDRIPQRRRPEPPRGERPRARLRMQRLCVIARAGAEQERYESSRRQTAQRSARQWHGSPRWIGDALGIVILERADPLLIRA